VVLKANIALAFLAKDLFEDEARHEQFQANLPAGFEIYPVADDEVELASLIEQELLLELPIVPAHENCPVREVGAESGGTSEDFSDKGKENPFSVLLQLKSKLRSGDQ
jgi:uncharacterized metal-binding protein YceD (DUF177 family)